jgi:hypothetical protein
VKKLQGSHQDCLVGMFLFVQSEQRVDSALGRLVEQRLKDALRRRKQSFGYQSARKPTGGGKPI